MIGYEDALNIIRDAGGGRILSAETMDTGDIAGRIAAEDIVSRMDNQPFDNSGMDGFAVRISDFAAAHCAPVQLTQAGHIAAGDGHDFPPLPAGHCYAIMTGAKIPPGCDAVIPVEDSKRQSETAVVFASAPSPGANIRRTGEDYKAGDRIAAKGDVLSARHILALATLGIASVKVVRRPQIALIATGREVIDDLSQPLKNGQIYNSSRPYLRVALSAIGADVTTGAAIPDDPAAFRARLLSSLESDIIVSTGAVSEGAHDFIPSVLKDMDAEILFHKVAVRPGKPVLFARLPDGGPLFVGLPGNPAASAAGARFFVYPLIRAMQGLPAEQPVFAVAAQGWNGKSGKPFTFFMRGRTYTDRQGILRVELPARQQSFMVRPFAECNVWCAIPADIPAVNVGDSVAVYSDQ